MSKMLLNSPVKTFFEKTVWKEFGDRIHDRDFMVAAFKRHNAEVERSIPKERLLVYEVAQGWVPLCEFLGVPVPDSPFPKANSREELGAMRDGAAAQSGELDLDKLQAAIKARLAN
jgi:hypothetical protein